MWQTLTRNHKLKSARNNNFSVYTIIFAQSWYLQKSIFYLSFLPNISFRVFLPKFIMKGLLLIWIFNIS